MKMLLLAVLASSPLMTPVSQEPEMWPMCEYNQVYRATYYYQYPGGPECGIRYMYCWGDVRSYQEGCQTSYYDVWYADCTCQ